MKPFVRSTFHWIQKQFSAQRVVAGSQWSEEIRGSGAVRVAETRARRQPPEQAVIYRLRRDLELGHALTLKFPLVLNEEVVTPFGTAKMVTPSEVIEIAPVYNWQEALVQVECLKPHFPDLLGRLHLYGRIRPARLRCIRAKCASRGIVVSHDRYFGC